VWHFLAAFLVLLAFALLCDAKLWRPRDVFTIAENIQIAEAQAWWQGKLDLPERKWDSALYNGKVYSHFPPLFSFLSALITPFYNGVPHWFVVLIVVLPTPILGNLLFRRLSGSAVWGATLAFGLVCGTSSLPVLEKTLRGAGPYFVNQALALTGVLIFLREYFGKQRWALAGAGVVMAAWSRQMTVAYLLAFAWMILRSVAPAGASGGRSSANQGLRFAPPLATNLAPSGGRTGAVDFRGSHTSKRWATACVALTIFFAIGVPMGMNWLKFGSPLESGYMHVYEGRSDDVFAKDAREHGIFSLAYVPRNLYYSTLGTWSLQPIKRGNEYEWHLSPQLWGTGILWTTPLIVFVFFDLRGILTDPKRRMLLLAAGLAYIGLMVYHSTGYKQRGYNRYSLDYLPVLFALAVPAAMASPWRKAVTVMLIAWSVGYFAFVRHWPQIRIW